jgi:hypothetical protein
VGLTDHAAIETEIARALTAEVTSRAVVIGTS